MAASVFVIWISWEWLQIQFLVKQLHIGIEGKIGALNGLTRQNIPQNGGVETGGPEVNASCTFHTHYSFLQLSRWIDLFLPYLFSIHMFSLFL